MNQNRKGGRRTNPSVRKMIKRLKVPPGPEVKPMGNSTRKLYVADLEAQQKERLAKEASPSRQMKKREIADELVEASKSQKFSQAHVDKIVGSYDAETVEHLRTSLSPAKRIRYGNAIKKEQRRMIFEAAKKPAENLPRAEDVPRGKPATPTHVEKPRAPKAPAFTPTPKKPEAPPKAGERPSPPLPPFEAPKAGERPVPAPPPFTPAEPEIDIEALRTDCRIVLGVQELPKTIEDKLNQDPESIQVIMGNLPLEQKVANLNNFLGIPVKQAQPVSEEIRNEVCKFISDLSSIGVNDSESKIGILNVYEIEGKIKEVVEGKFPGKKQVLPEEWAKAAREVLDIYPTLEDQLEAGIFETLKSGVIEVGQSGLFTSEGIEPAEGYKVKVADEINPDLIRQAVKAYSPRKQKKFAKRAKKELLKVAKAITGDKGAFNTIVGILDFPNFVEYVKERVPLETPEDIEDAAVICLLKERLVTKSKENEEGLLEVDKDPKSNQIAIWEAVKTVKGITKEEIETKRKRYDELEAVIGSTDIEQKEDESTKITRNFEKVLETKLQEAKTEAETKTPAVLTTYEHAVEEFFKNANAQNFPVKLKEFLLGPLEEAYVTPEQLEERLSKRLKVYDEIFTLVQKHVNKVAKSHISTEVKKQLTEEALTNALSKYLEDPDAREQLLADFTPAKGKSKKGKKGKSKPAERAPVKETSQFTKQEAEKIIKEELKEIISQDYVTQLAREEVDNIIRERYEGFVNYTAEKATALAADKTFQRIRDEKSIEKAAAVHVRREVEDKEKELKKIAKEAENSKKMAWQHARQAKEANWFAKYGKFITATAATLMVGALGLAHINKSNLETLEEKLAQPVIVTREVEKVVYQPTETQPVQTQKRRVEVVSQPAEPQPKEVVSQPVEPQPKEVVSQPEAQTERRVVTRDTSKRLYVPRPRGRGYKLIELVETPEGEKMLIADGKRFCTIGDIDKDPDGPVYFEEKIAKKLKRLGKVPEDYQTRKIIFRTENFLHGPDTNQDGQPDLVDNKGHTYESLPGNKNVFTERRKLARK